MFRRIYALVIKEFLAVWQDKKSRYVLIGPPLIQLIIFSFAATLDVTNASIGILNRDSGKLSFELIQRFIGAPVIKHVKYLQSEDEIKTVMDNQEVMMVIHIDAQFSRNLLAQMPANVQLILDGRKSNTTQILEGYAENIIEQYNQDLSTQFNYPQPTTVLVPRNWFNPNLIYQWFIAPALIGILTMLVSLLLTSMSIAREKELGTFEQLLVSPLQPMDILTGKAIPAIVLGMGEGSIILAAAVFVFQIPFTGSLAALYLAMFVFVCSIVGIGLFLSALSKTQQQALLAVLVFMSPAVILSGFATPIENMPVWMQKLTLFNPLSYFLIIVRGVFLKELPFSQVFQNVYPIALIALFTLSTSTLFFRKRLQ
jgi:ABC-2 type transport system permease protein